MTSPPRRKLAAFRLDREIIDGLRRVKERDGIPTSEQVRRALIEWLAHRGVRVRPAPRRLQKDSVE